MLQRKRKPQKPKFRSKASLTSPIHAADAPLFYTLQLLAAGDSARFHMPGHKGEPVFSSFADIFAIDFTETYGTGNLYMGAGPIQEAEEAAAQYWDAAGCFFLTGGATQGIFAMLATAAGYGGSVLFDRACHRSACHACALMDIKPYFIAAPLIDPFAISGALSVSEAERQLKAHPDIEAVFLTSPTYYGVRQSIPRFAELCAAYEVKLLVDAAHGAHFPAVGLPVPVTEGADAVVLSTHKTLPSLGQGAVLLFSERMDARLLRENTALFGTSSPSYPIMASIDLARAYMKGPGKAAYQRVAKTCAELRSMINNERVFRALCTNDYPLLDPCRLTICTAGTNLTGDELSDELWSRYGVACEMSDSNNVVFILTGQDSNSSLRRLQRGLQRSANVHHATLLPPSSKPFSYAERVMSVRDAWFAEICSVPVADAKGRICARPVTPYPPGIPLLWPGEKITRTHVELIREKWYNEIGSIFTVKKS